uniref:Uncharacterized protein n=1 Tax=Lepeophtheirus salmonis TaxID=72036 RepID=A0A0K2UWZ9_LEPSM
MIINSKKHLILQSKMKKKQISIRRLRAMEISLCKTFFFLNIITINYIYYYYFVYFGET